MHLQSRSYIPYKWTYLRTLDIFLQHTNFYQYSQMNLRASFWGWKWKKYVKSFMKTFWTVIIYHQRKMAFQAILHMLVIYVDITCAQINSWKMPKIFCYNFVKCLWRISMPYMTCPTLQKQTRSVCPATHQFHWSLVHEKWPTY